MATRDEIKALFLLACDSYPTVRSESPETLASVARVWQRVLDDLSAKEIDAALLQYQSEAHEWRPNPGQLRAIAIRRRVGRTPSAIEGWHEVQGFRSSSARKLSHPVLARVVELIGYERLVDEETGPRLLSLFERTYREIGARYVEAVHTLPALRDGLPLLTYENASPELPTYYVDERGTPRRRADGKCYRCADSGQRVSANGRSIVFCSCPIGLELVGREARRVRSADIMIASLAREKDIDGSDA